MEFTVPALETAKENPTLVAVRILKSKGALAFKVIFAVPRVPATIETVGRKVYPEPALTRVKPVTD